MGCNDGESYGGVGVWRLWYSSVWNVDDAVLTALLLWPNGDKGNGDELWRGEGLGGDWKGMG